MTERENESFNVKVFGCGISGVNTVQKIYRSNIPGIEVIAVSHDAWTLLKKEANYKILFGKYINMGLGGRGPEAAEKDLLEVDSLIRNKLNGFKTAILTAGLGGIFSSVIPGYISRVAKEINNDGIVISVITTPSKFQGKTRRDNAIYGLKKMMDYSDVIILTSMDSITKLVNIEFSEELFKVADEILAEIIIGLIKIIDEETKENREKEMRDIFKKGKMGTIGIGESSYPSDDESSGIKDAIEEALDSPLILGDLNEYDTAVLMAFSNQDISASALEIAEGMVRSRLKTISILKSFSFVDGNYGNEVTIILLLLG